MVFARIREILLTARRSQQPRISEISRDPLVPRQWTSFWFDTLEKPPRLLSQANDSTTCKKSPNFLELSLRRISSETDISVNACVFMLCTCPV